MAVMSLAVCYTELQQNNDMMVTDYGLFAANPMGASFDQSSTGAPAIGGWSANQQRVPSVVSTLRRSQQATINSPRYVVCSSFVVSITISCEYYSEAVSVSK